MTPREEYDAEIAAQIRGFRFKIVKTAAGFLATAGGFYFVSVRGGMDPTTAAWLTAGSTVAGLVLAALIILWIHKRG